MSRFGMTLTALATGLADAVSKDEAEMRDPSIEDKGFDLSAGLFGVQVSAWLREVATEIAGNENAPQKQSSPCRPSSLDVHSTSGTPVTEISPRPDTEAFSQGAQK